MAESRSSFSWTKFTGGQWDEWAQGATDDPAYKTALNVSENGQAVEQGPWVRRSGLRHLADIAASDGGIVRTFWMANHQPATMFISSVGDASYMRIWTQQYPGTQSDDLMPLCDQFIQIEYISNTNPAYIILASVPGVCMNGNSGWGEGDLINIYIDPSVALINGAGYVGRTLVVRPGGYDGRQWYLMDPETSEYIDGTQSGLSVATIGTSYAGHIVQIDLPYTSLDEVRLLRLVQTGQSAFLLSKITPPVIIQQVWPAPSIAPNVQAPWFSVGYAQLIDGPYFDQIPGGSQTGCSPGVISTINDDSVCTFEITDASYVFQPTDVGRQLRIWCQPAPYEQGTSYTVGSRVTYLGTFFESLGSNGGGTGGTSSIPLTDTSWYIVPDAGRIGYGIISAVNVGSNAYKCSLALINPTGPGGGLDNATVVANGTSSAGTPGTSANCDFWQIGVYTAGQYPSCGAYYQGRLFLGGAIPGRVDASASNGGSLAGFMTIPVASNPNNIAAQIPTTGGTDISQVLFLTAQAAIGSPAWGTSLIDNGALGRPAIPGATVNTAQVYFTPTNASGQELDDNGIEAELNAAEQDTINYLHPTNDGLILGSLSGEHLLAAAQGSVLTPASVEVTPISGYGSGTVEPLRIGNALIFVQSLGKLLVEYIVDFFMHRFVGRNLNIYAKQLTSAGIRELAYAEEQTPTIFTAQEDGSLCACTYRRLSAFSNEPPTMMGWSKFTLPNDQNVMSICMSANQAGNLDQLVVLTTDAPIPPLSPVQAVPYTPAEVTPAPPPPPIPSPPPPSPVSPVTPSPGDGDGSGCCGCCGDCGDCGDSSDSSDSSDSDSGSDGDGGDGGA